MARVCGYSYTFTSTIRGFHVYRSVWEPTLNDKLTVKKEADNVHDNNAVCILKESVIVGHAPRELAHILSNFINHSGEIHVEVKDCKYRHSSVAGGLEISATYTITGKVKLVKKAKLLIEKHLN